MPLKRLQSINSYPLIITEGEEFKHFIEFYKILFKKLPELQLKEDEIIEIAKDTVFNDEKFFFHEDVFETIPKLSNQYKLGVEAIVMLREDVEDMKKYSEHIVIRSTKELLELLK